MTGIYRITNLKNSKSYIGQSKDIYRRWKQHTSNLNKNSDETILRRAFVKYNLFQQISSEGKYGNFIFEIIETCDQDDLLEREYYYLKKEEPAYNIMLLPPNELQQFNSKRKQHHGEYFIQYHNFDKEQHYPGFIEGEEGDRERLICDCAHYISTRKNLAAYLDGAFVILIFGITINKGKRYYIWTRTDVDELEFIEDEDLSYNIIGFQEYIKPICLNKILGFSDFQKKLGNFAYGLSSISNYPFTNTIIEICEENKAEDDMTSSSFIELYKKAFSMHDSGLAER